MSESEQSVSNAAHFSESATIADRLIANLADTSELKNNKAPQDKLEILLTDYLVNAISAKRIRSHSGSRFQLASGISESAAMLAIDASSNDIDDVDWTVMTHPGSIVWSSLFATALYYEASRKNFLTAALSGYRTSASIASLFGKSHRIGWHVTATAGTFAAASATAVALGLTKNQHIRALYCAASTAGGIGQAAWERSGAARLNRAMAASSGSLAAQLAVSNIATVENPWDGPRGLFELFSIDAIEILSRGDSSIRDGVSTSSLRLFPVNGFGQSAVLAATQLSRKLGGTVESINIEVPSSIISLIDGFRGGPFWNLRLGVAAAWRSGDPMVLVFEGEEVEQLSRLVSISGNDLLVGGATVTATTSRGSDRVSLRSPPGGDFSSTLEVDWRREKWDRLLGHSYDPIAQIAQKLVREETTDETWKHLEKILGSV